MEITFVAPYSQCVCVYVCGGEGEGLCWQTGTIGVVFWTQEYGKRCQYETCQVTKSWNFINNLLS